MYKSTFIQQLIIASASSGASPKDIVARAFSICRLAEKEFVEGVLAEHPTLQYPADMFYEPDYDNGDSVAQSLGDIASAISEAK